MVMPIDLVLVRHGESEGNIATGLSKQGDDSLYTEEYRSRHSGTWRLTPRGVEQAQAAGEWIRKNLWERFDRNYVSEYVRARETAGNLALSDDAQWYIEARLRERNWGDLDRLPRSEQREKFTASLQDRKMDSFFWTPPNGESIAQVCETRLRSVLDTLHRECGGQRVIIVSHGEVMWAFRVLLERMTQEQFYDLDQSRNPHDTIHNCQIIHYTRRDPQTDEISKRYEWMRSVCPWDENLSSNTWMPIKRLRFSNQDLLGGVQKYSHMFSDE